MNCLQRVTHLWPPGDRSSVLHCLRSLGRPDMAIFDFASRMEAGIPITLFGEGQLSRDFTFVDDIVRGLLAAAHDKAPLATSKSGHGVNESGSPHKILNLARGEPVTVLEMVSAIESALGVSAIINLPIDNQEMWITHWLISRKRPNGADTGLLPASGKASRDSSNGIGANTQHSGADDIQQRGFVCRDWMSRHDRTLLVAQQAQLAALASIVDAATDATNSRSDDSPISRAPHHASRATPPIISVGTRTTCVIQRQ